MVVQHPQRWQAADISFEVLDDMTDAPVVTLQAFTPAGKLLLTGEPVYLDSTLLLRRAHVQGATANAVGAANLMVVVQAFLEVMGYNGLEIEGAVRTTGANPGHTPRVFRFTRRIRLATTGGPDRPQAD